MKEMMKKDIPQERGSELEEGYIKMGSPFKRPERDQPFKPDRPELTSRDSRLHSGHYTKRGTDDDMPCCLIYPEW